MTDEPCKRKINQIFTWTSSLSKKFPNCILVRKFCNYYQCKKNILGYNKREGSRLTAIEAPHRLLTPHPSVEYHPTPPHFSCTTSCPMRDQKIWRQCRLPPIPLMEITDKECGWSSRKYPPPLYCVSFLCLTVCLERTAFLSYLEGVWILIWPRLHNICCHLASSYHL